MSRTPVSLALCVALAVGGASGTTGCGASREEILEQQVKDLKGELFDARQRAGDLKVRANYIRARNRVLVGLVEGLTSKSDGTSTNDAGGPMASAKRALEALDHDMEVIGVTLRQTRKDVTELRGERAELKTNLDDAIQRIQEAQAREAQAQSRVETFRSMLLRLRSMIESNELELQIVRNQMVVKLPEAVLFDTAEAELKPRGRDVLAGLAEVLKGIDGRDFQVAGYTDDVPIATPRYKTNWHLSAARAINVTRLLVKQGVSRERLSAVAYADTRPVDPGHSAEARRKNRRIEIAVMPRLEELPDLSLLDEVAREGQVAPVAPDAPPVAASGVPAPGAVAPAPAAAAPSEPAPAATATPQVAAPVAPAASPASSSPPPPPPATEAPVAPPAPAAPASEAAPKEAPASSAPPPTAAPPAQPPAPPKKPAGPEPVKPRELPPGYGDPPK